MQKEELEEKVTMMEELIQGLVDRMNGVEAGMTEVLTTFLDQYRGTLEAITARIEAANKRYDDKKIQQQIDELNGVVRAVPKVIGVKNSHHFGAWSKSLIIGVVIGFFVTAGSVGTALYLNHQNDRLNSEAYNFWLVRALYPQVSKVIETKLAEDPKGLIEKAEKAMAIQLAIIAAEAEAAQAEKEHTKARQKLERVERNK